MPSSVPRIRARSSRARRRPSAVTRAPREADVARGRELLGDVPRVRDRALGRLLEDGELGGLAEAEGDGELLHDRVAAQVDHVLVYVRAAPVARRQLPGATRQEGQQGGARVRRAWGRDGMQGASGTRGLGPGLGPERGLRRARVSRARVTCTYAKSSISGSAYASRAKSRRVSSTSAPSEAAEKFQSTIEPYLRARYGGDGGRRGQPRAAGALRGAAVPGCARAAAAMLEAAVLDCAHMK